MKIKAMKIKGMKIKGLSPVARIVLALGCAAVSGCESTGSRYGAGGGGHASAAGGAYAPGDRLYRDDHLEAIYGSQVSPEQAKLMEKAAFRGVEGARLAHRLYRGSHAEALDGACESKIIAQRGETLWDISELCDVSIYVLSDYNPSLNGPNHVFEGEEINIPHTNSLNLEGVFDAEFNGVDALPLSPLTDASAIYHAEAGDTLSSIAVRHQVSAASLANLNPEIDWRDAAPVGAAIKLPQAKPLEIAVLAPRAKSAVHAEETTPSILNVSDTSVTPGGAVRLTAEGFAPFAAVSVFQGANRRSMTFIGEFTTDENGALNASATVSGGADLGGVIFAAAAGGETIYSPRVSVLKLKNAAR